MLFKNLPIQRKLMAIVLITSATVLLITGSVFFGYEFVTFKQTEVERMATVGKMLAANTTASLAFDNQNDAREMLDALKSESHILAAALYDQNDLLFAVYPEKALPAGFPAKPDRHGFKFVTFRLETFSPVIQKGKWLGTLYIQSDLGAVYERLKLYGLIVLIVLGASLAVAFFISKALQAKISGPVIALANTARSISEKRDYSVRAPKLGDDEFGLLTSAFNTMLEQIQNRDSALREAQSKLREHADGLEKRVLERTARLSETIAELESFSYSVSHDMRAPLRAMEGYSTFILEKFSSQLNPEVIQYLDRIRRAGSRLDNLVQDILTYSRLSQGQLDLHPVNLDKLVDDIVQQYPGFQTFPGAITITTPLGSVIGHEASLTQVISNLLGNALKFVEPGNKPSVRVWTESKGNQLWLHVEDQGIGIDQKDIDRIFRIFEKVNPEKAYQGTGIGLSIVKKAMERMHGDVKVESRLSKGSRFSIGLQKAATEMPDGLLAVSAMSSEVVAKQGAQMAKTR